MSDATVKMWAVTATDGKLFLRVYGDRQAVDVALKTWWHYYHSRGVVVEDFEIWILAVVVIEE